MSETSEEIKQKARDYGNSLVEKQETLNINKNTHYVDFSNPNADKISSASTTTIKQETLEEAAENYSEGWGENNDKKSFIAGAKWQQEPEQFFNDDRVKTLEKSIEYLLKKQERMYSEEEVMKIALLSRDRGERHGSILWDEWFEQFKKK